MKSIAVYCSASDSVPAVYRQDAALLGELLAGAGLEVLYGDGGIGLMGVLADSVLRHGGRITGVIPQFMVDQGWNNPRSTSTVITSTMHERKAYIASHADAFVALPGGIGTFEELLECLTWKQLGLHGKPVIIVNTNDYYTPLLSALDRMVSERFMQPIHRQRMFTLVDNSAEVIKALRSSPEWDAAEMVKHARS